MKTKEELAKEYANKENEYIYSSGNDYSMYSVKIAFEAGFEAAQKWTLIDRDKDGFAKNESLNDIMNNLPVLLMGTNWYEVADNTDWREEIKIHERYTYWRPINRK
jgi:hypothetical protein